MYAVGGEEAFSKQPISSLLLQCGHILREQLSHLMVAEGSRESFLLALSQNMKWISLKCYVTQQLFFRNMDHTHLVFVYMSSSAAGVGLGFRFCPF